VFVVFIMQLPTAPPWSAEGGWALGQALDS
jgi:hypothetical protein